MHNRSCRAIAGPYGGAVFNLNAMDASVKEKYTNSLPNLNKQTAGTVTTGPVENSHSMKFGLRFKIIRVKIANFIELKGLVLFTSSIRDGHRPLDSRLTCHVPVKQGQIIRNCGTRSFANSLARFS